MARIVRDSTPKRRSARLSNNDPQVSNRTYAELASLKLTRPKQSTRKTPALNPLGSVLERDETPDVIPNPSIDHVVSTPNPHRDLKERFSQLSKITTPKTEPKPANDQMHPATVHQTTAKAPDSGMKLGFADISTTGNASLASLQNTPSRPRQSLASTNIPPAFQFKFNHETNMSAQGQKLMESIRNDAARIKEQMLAEKEREAQQERENEGFDNATGRRIARPTAKAGRFSDVHMAQFKKMDSIANHPSSFRARPGFARPTAQSLKRSSSKADLDEPERPRTAGKASATRIPPPVIGRPQSTSPFKTIQSSSEPENPHSKRIRHDSDSDVSSSRATALPRPVSSRLLSPTKASSARTAGTTSTPPRPSIIPKASSIKSVRSASRPTAPVLASPSRLPQFQFGKALPALPIEEDISPAKRTLFQSVPSKKPTSPAKDTHVSRLPTIEQLKSILRSPRKTTETAPASPPKQISSLPVPASSQKKVDFTPSVKSRYAVKLAEASPSPAKVDRSRPSDHFEPAIPYDSSAFVIHDYSEEWEDDDSDVVYPSLPTLSPRQGTSSGAFASKAKDHSRRESKEFKSIFTTIPKETTTSLTSVNTTVNRTNPLSHAARVAKSPPKLQQSPSTIRHVRTSEPIQPFEDSIETVPHGLPGKKRHIDSAIADDKFGQDDDAKENRRVIHHSAMPGSWNDATIEATIDEGDQRGGKRARFEKAKEPEKVMTGSPIKKSAAREAAVKSARDRKSKASIGGAASTGKGVLSLSRLNMLARPKSRASGV